MQKARFEAIEVGPSGEDDVMGPLISAKQKQRVERYIAESGREEERYRKERCRFYQYLEGPWTGPAEARCLTETLIDRAVDLEVIQQNMPR